MLTALLRNWRASNEFLILAPTLEVAQNSFKPAADMIAADPELAEILKVQTHLRTITDQRNGSTLKVVAADNNTVSGKKAAGVLIDELWLFGKQPNAENMLREATGGQVSRPEGFTIFLTTQSDDPPAGVFKQKLDYFRDLRDGKIVNPRAMGVLYECPKAIVDSGAHLEPENFYITNPNLGVSVDREWLIEEFEKAQNAGDASLRGFAAKHLNIEIGMGLRTDRWPGAEFWERGADPELVDLDAILERSEVAVVGIDGGGLDDLFGLAVLGREKGRERWLLWSHAWCHEGVLERRKSIASRLRDFEKAGDLTIVDDRLDDIREIVAVVQSVKDRGLLAAVAVDPAGSGVFVDELAKIGVTKDDDNLIGVPQGFGLMNALKTGERRLANGTLRHGGSSLMAWCVGNLKIEPTATAIRATKQNAGDANIDPAMALFNAAYVMTSNPEANVRSGRDTDDIEGLMARIDAAAAAAA